MPSSKDKGQGKGSPRKKSAARRVHTRASSTKSKKQARIEEDQYNTLAAISSPKPKPNPKKRSLRSESTTSPLLGEKTPDRRKPVPQVVTLPKKIQALSEESSDDNNSTAEENAPVTKEQENASNTSNSTGDGNSTRDENASRNTNSTGNASATMNTPFDTKLEHVLINYLRAAGADHHIRKAFIHEDILTFEDFTDICTVENIKTFQRDDGNNNLVQAFSNAKPTLITNACLYYKFLMDDSQEVLAEDPVSWVKSDFRKWKTLP